VDTAHLPFGWITIMSSHFPLNPGPPVTVQSGAQNSEASSWVEREVTPLIQRGQEAFRRVLPELLKKHRGDWVAFSGDRQIGLGRSKRELHQRCLDQGLSPNDFVVRGIGPEMPDELDWEEFRDV
jgi:hypothetical protein